MNEKDFTTLISELDMDDNVKNSIMSFIRNGQMQKALQVLKKYRSTVLAGLHSDQDRLYQVDYVLHEADKEEWQ